LAGSEEDRLNEVELRATHGSSKTTIRSLQNENFVGCAHHAEGLVDPKVLAKKTVTDFGYPRACRFRKYTNFFQNVI
jgi:hypothetical protein